MNLSAEQQVLLAGIPDPMFRQTVRNFCVNLAELTAQASEFAEKCLPILKELQLA